MQVLIVRLRQIGDVVFTTPAIRALRLRFPHAHLAYLVEPAAAAVLHGNPNLDEVIVAPRARGVRGLAADVRLMAGLRARRFDLVIDFHGGPRASLLTWASGAAQRIGYDVPWRRWMYTTHVARARALRARHSVENQWDLLAPLDVARPSAEHCPVEMPVDVRARARVASHLAAAGVRTAERLIVMHVSAGNPFRRWPEPSFAQVAARLAEDPNTAVIVTAGPSDKDAAGRVVASGRERLGAGGARIVEGGDLPLPELRALVDRAALYIGGDSGPLHVASTSQVAIVALYGPTLPARSAPWRPASIPSEAIETHGLPCRPCDQRRCEPGDFRCLTWIGPEEVIAAARRLLDGGNRRSTS
jgi:ADP-heptose:LPS heptosyltransferase